MTDITSYLFSLFFSLFFWQLFNYCTYSLFNFFSVCAASGSKMFQLLEIVYRSSKSGTLPSGLVSIVYYVIHSWYCQEPSQVPWLLLFSHPRCREFYMSFVFSCCHYLLFSYFSQFFSIT